MQGTKLNVLSPLPDIERTNGETDVQESMLSRYLVPKGGIQLVNGESRGVFIPYPLLIIFVTLAIALVGGLITLEVQVNNLSTTLLLRDSDQKTSIERISGKVEQLEVYIHDDREKIIHLQDSDSEQNNKLSKH